MSGIYLSKGEKGGIIPSLVFEFERRERRLPVVEGVTLEDEGVGLEETLSAEDEVSNDFFLLLPLRGTLTLLLLVTVGIMSQSGRISLTLEGLPIEN